jgi:hypothetical protein
MIYPNRVSAATLLALAVLAAAGCGGPTAPSPAAPTPPTPDPTIPLLVAPAQGAILDNGCYNQQDLITWDFEWSAVPGATRYHLLVQGANAEYPVIDTIATATTYRSSHIAYIVDRNRTGWQWRVQAEVNGAFRPYSPTRSFDVEPADTDCR